MEKDDSKARKSLLQILDSKRMAGKGDWEKDRFLVNQRLGQLEEQSRAMAEVMGKMTSNMEGLAANQQSMQDLSKLQDVLNKAESGDAK